MATITGNLKPQKMTLDQWLGENKQHLNFEPLSSQIAKAQMAQKLQEQLIDLTLNFRKLQMEAEQNAAQRAHWDNMSRAAMAKATNSGASIPGLSAAEIKMVQDANYAELKNYLESGVYRTPMDAYADIIQTTSPDARRALLETIGVDNFDELASTYAYLANNYTPDQGIGRVFSNISNTASNQATGINATRFLDSMTTGKSSIPAARYTGVGSPLIPFLQQYYPNVQFPEKDLHQKMDYATVQKMAQQKVGYDTSKLVRDEQIKNSMAYNLPTSIDTSKTPITSNKQFGIGTTSLYPNIR